jgi:general L-amino acid transport system permease protein
MNDDNVGVFWLMMLLALISAIVVWRWRTRVNIETGLPHHRVLFSLGAFMGIGLIAYLLLGRPLRMSWPRVSESGRLIEGGLPTNDAYVALTLALALYTASHIAEIIRGSILAVPKGQNEAANALALNSFQRYRFVVLPQALRIAIPPIINQFLNLTKNTSLAVAVAYPDVTQVVRTAIGNGQPATQMILALMLIYLTFSLLTSLVLNIVNRRFQLAGR